MLKASQVRNVAIIAHVDHGKTTMVDHLLRQAGLFEAHQAVTDRVMDSDDIERERGITIMAKNAAFRIGDVHVNLVDTPGHSDFGGEVERIMGMVDGTILLVDAAEGPLPQTRFVLSKAIAQGLAIVLCINKVDRPEVQGTGRISEVIDRTFELFLELGATDAQCDFPIIYACAKLGWCTSNLDEVPALVSGEVAGNMKPMFNLILEVVPPPKILDDTELRVQVANLSYSSYVGQLAIGRIVSGTLRRSQILFLHTLDTSGAPRRISFTTTRLYLFDGLARVEVDSVPAGEIAMVAGSSEFAIGDTITDSDAIVPMPRLVIEPPTIKMSFSINTSPLSGKEGKAIQSRELRERLVNETRSNVAVRFQEGETSEQFYLYGRGELQFAVLIEKMRREGFEFMVGRPMVLIEVRDGGRWEPMERVSLDLPEVYAGEVTELLQRRKGSLTSYEPDTLVSTRVRLKFEIPTRGLLGIRSRYLTVTRGEGLMSSEAIGYMPHKGDIPHRTTGSLICDRSGKSVEYALSLLEDRGVLFIDPGAEVYEGMIIGEGARENDLNVNPCREKKLTNIRTTASDGLTILAGIRKMTLERCIEWIEEDEWIEVTPQNVRLRKKTLLANLRSVRRADRIT